MRKNILIITSFFFLIFLAYPVSASEFMGRISTDQNELKKINEEAGIGHVSHQSALLLGMNVENKNNNAVVLGISTYGEGALLRGPDKRIYILQGGERIYLASLEQLKRFSGHRIYDVGIEVLSSYGIRKYLYGDLVRVRGRTGIYAISDKGLRLVLSPAELSRFHRGQEIYSVEAEELSVYL